MLYDLIQKKRGKETIIMTDELSKVNDRVKTLRRSQRKGIKGQRIEYSISPSNGENPITEYFINPEDYGCTGCRGNPCVCKELAKEQNNG